MFVQVLATELQILPVASKATSSCFIGFHPVVQGVLVHCNVHLKNIQRLEHFVAKALHDWKVGRLAS